MKPIQGLFRVFLISTLLLNFNNSEAQWTQIGADIDGEQDNDQSGNSVSISSDGSIVAIGAHNFSFSRGKVRVYKNKNNNWTKIGNDIIGEANNDLSGFSVSLSANGSMLAIGAPNHSEYRGHVKVYKNINNSWIQLGSDIVGQSVGETSGQSVSLSGAGSFLAIGGENGNKVRIFKYVNGTWDQIGADIDGEANIDNSGHSVSLSSDGSIVAIGAPTNAGGGVNRGHVRIFKNVNGTWTQIGTDIDGEQDEDQSGSTVTLSRDGTTVAIGSYLNSDVGPYRGHVRIFKNVNGTWTQIGADIDGEQDNDLSGWSVSLSSDGFIVAIGAINNIVGGKVRVYKYVNGTWDQIGADIDGEANSNASGYSVSLSVDGSILAIGAPNNHGDGLGRGHVRVYALCSQTQKFLNAILAMAKQKGKKVYVCHQGIYTLQVSVSDFYFHLFHGDKLGKCDVNYCEGLQLRSNDLENYIGTQEDKSAEENMVLYPNPAQQILNVKLPYHTDTPIQIRVYNSLGQSMINQPYYFNGKDHGALPVNIRKLPQGLYFLKASGEGYEKSKPFTKF